MTLELLDKNVEKKIWTNSWASLQVTKVIRLQRKKVLRYTYFGVANQEGSKLTIFEKGQNRVQPKTVFMVFDQKRLWKIWLVKKLSLSGNEVGLFAKNDGLKGQKVLTLNNHQFSVKEEFNTDLIVH